MRKNYSPCVFFYCLRIVLILIIERWFSIWMVLELNSLCFIAILLERNKNYRKEICLTYFLIQAIRSLILLLSLINVFATKAHNNSRFILLCRVIIKIAISPIHLWAIPIRALISWSSLYLLSTAQKILPLVILEKYSPELTIIFIRIIVISRIIASALNIRTNNLKIILILSALANSRWILVRIIIRKQIWKLFLLIYLLTLSFLITQSKKKTKKIHQSTFFMLLRIGGIPPFIGFFPKLIIILQSSLWNTVTILLLLILIAVIDLFIYTRFLRVSLIKIQNYFWMTEKKIWYMYFISNLIVGLTIIFY